MTADELREWEVRLGPEKVKRAIDIVRAAGWQNEPPPNFIWAQVFAEVEAEGERTK